MPSSQITMQNVDEAIRAYERDPQEFADRDNKYALVVNNRKYPPKIIYALAKSIAAGETDYSKKKTTKGVSASTARSELTNLKLTIVPVKDYKCEAIASRFVSEPSYERLKSGSKIYKAKLVSFGSKCYIGFKFSEQGKGFPKPGLAIYVKKGKKQDFITEFSSFKVDPFKYNDKQASESDDTGWVSFCRDDCNTLDDAYTQIVDPGEKFDEWNNFFRSLVKKVQDFVKEESDLSKRLPELLPQEGQKQAVPLKGTDGKFLPRNLIWFGAPGTGKSHDAKAKIGEYFANAKETDDSIRTTFHPDSDYASFVGSYKPTMADCGHSRPRKQLSLDELALKLKSEVDAAGAGKEKTKILAVDLFGEEYSDILRDVSSLDLLNKAGLKASYSHNLDDSIKVGNYRAIHPDHPEKRIVYSFVPQAFTKAYVKAWEKMAKNPQSPERQFLVIEEINRGNCAQIFGDLFQLLDRTDSEYSKYPIEPDADLRKYLCDWFSGKVTTMQGKLNEKVSGDVSVTWSDILSGSKLVLPPNLYIWATMNTSDQSLFPMDSAFKRRWDWKYSKIKDEGKNYRILDGGEEGFVWWEFLEKINAVIRNVTQSADKQLGYFFVKLPDDLSEGERIIDAETFVNKVIFYLWNDVFKDCELDDDAFMVNNNTEKDSGNNTNSKRQLTFDDFFDDGGNIKEDVAKGFLDKLLPKVSTTPNQQTPLPSSKKPSPAPSPEPTEPAPDK